jgi:hypothetical protein
MWILYAFDSIHTVDVAKYLSEEEIIIVHLQVQSTFTPIYISISAASKSTPVTCVYFYRTYLSVPYSMQNRVLPPEKSFPDVSQFTSDKPSGVGLTLYSRNVLSAHGIPRRHVLLHAAVEAGFFVLG